MRPSRRPRASKSATLVLVPPMSPAIIMSEGRLPRNVCVKRSRGGRGGEHARGERERGLVDHVARKNLKLGAEALAFRARLVVEHAPHVGAPLAPAHARLKL